MSFGDAMIAAMFDQPDQVLYSFDTTQAKN